MQRLIVRQPVEYRFDEVFGLWPGDKSGRSDFEFKPKELLLSSDVLDGLVTEAAGDEGLVDGKLLRSKGASGMGQKGGAIKTEDMQEQKLRIAMGMVAEIGVRGELVGGESQCLT